MEAAFFDLDKTIVSAVVVARAVAAAVPSGHGLARPARARRVRAARVPARRRRRAEDGAPEGRHARSSPKAGTAARSSGSSQDVLLEVIDPYVYAEALDLIDAASQRGTARSTSCRSSPEEIVRPLARHFGVERRDRDPRPGRRRRPLHGRPRVLRLRRAEGRGDPRDRRRASGIDLAGSYAYSDSITDLPMLEAVGHPVAVNPDRELRRIAEERDWELRDFRRPVRLRTRIASAVPAPAERRRRLWAASAVAAVLVWVVLRSRRPATVAPPECPARGTARCGPRRPGVGSSRVPGGPRGEQNPRASHAAGGMLQDPGRTTPAPEHVQASA